MGLKPIKVLEEIDKLRDWGLETLTKMISVPTVSPLGDRYEEFKNLIVEELSHVGITPKVITVPSEVVKECLGPEPAKYPRYIIIAKVGSGSTFHLNGHYDVVPGGSGWTVTEPFKPRVIDGKVYGRGSTDMKGGIASALLTLLALMKFESHLNFTYEVAMVPDEEVGGKSGTGYLVKSGISKPKYVVIAEGSSTRSVWIGHKGIVWGRVIVRGRPAHASTPWLGVNAFEKGVEVAQLFIKELKPRIESKVSKYEYDIKEGKKATIMFGGVVKGGAKINQVPSEFTFTFDRRVLPEESVEEVWREIKGFTNELRRRGYDIDVELISSSNPVVTEPTTDLVIKLKEATKEVVGIEPRATVCIGGLDMRYYIEAGYKAVTYGPGTPKTAHAPDEFIVYEDVIKVAKIYALTALKLFNLA